METREHDGALADLVSPLQGTDSHQNFSQGNCLPIVSRPFGMAHWSLQTDEGRWLFDRRVPKLQGVRLTHQPSPWMWDYGHFTVMAQTGTRTLGAGQRSSSYRLDKSEVKPYFVKTNLIRYDTILELTPTERCGFFRLTFPTSETGRVILQPFDGDSYVEVRPDENLIVGYTRANSGGVTENFASYFVAAFDRPWVSAAPFQGRDVAEGVSERSGERVGAVAEFAPSAEPLLLRLATSFVSIEQTQRNLEQELGTRPFEAVKAEAAQVWNEALGKVEIEGATELQRRTFYTCLYRANLFPRPIHEYNDEGKPIHYSPYDGKVHDGVLYTDNGFWDTYRTMYALLSVVYSQRWTEILNGWVNAAKEGGWFPRWPSPGYRACMIGTHMDAIIADAVTKGERGFDIEAAYTAMRRNAFEVGDDHENYGRRGIREFTDQGFVPADRYDAATACTQDYAYNDWCIAQVAKVLGRDDDYRILIERATNYRNVYDPNVGFMRGRNADGKWEEPFREFGWGGAYVEGGPWQSTWAVPHDPQGLIDLMGGREAFVAKLDRMLELPPHFEAGTYGGEIHEMTEMAVADFGQYAQSNQPVHHVLTLFACAGEPWKMQHWVRRVLNELYSPDSLPGDEDNGEMAAWYVLNALGFYPLCPGVPQYVIGTPLFPRATIHLDGGSDLVIRAEGSAPGSPYVQSMAWNGEAYHSTWIAHGQLVAGGEWTFTMGTEPRTGITYTTEQLPYSLSNS
jgi:predicted alpha-1,2-mannosidase